MKPTSFRTCKQEASLGHFIGADSDKTAAIITDYASHPSTTAEMLHANGKLVREILSKPHMVMATGPEPSIQSSRRGANIATVLAFYTLHQQKCVPKPHYMAVELSSYRRDILHLETYHLGISTTSRWYLS